MAKTHNLGFPRIGANRELKFALENYWNGESSTGGLLRQAKKIRQQNWQRQQQLDYVPVGDFSLYDHVLDTSILVGNVPKRATVSNTHYLDSYFSIARGHSNEHGCSHAAEMTKWFDTNYHYIVPELNRDTVFSLNSVELFKQIEEAQQLGLVSKPVIIGPVTYLWLAKTKDNSNKLELLDKLIPIYCELLIELQNRGIEWVQIDEPILTSELDQDWQKALELAYHGLKHCKIKLLLTSYFGELGSNLLLATSLPVAGIHLDAISARGEITRLMDWLPVNKVLSLGVINGRNIWKTDLNTTLDWLEPIAKKLKDRLWLAPSCSLLHVPVDLDTETKIDSEAFEWLAFAQQKLTELETLAKALNQGRASVAIALEQNHTDLLARRQSTFVHKPAVKQAVNRITEALGRRQSSYARRAHIQAEHISLPLLPTTTIGSFPQTQEIRRARRQFKHGQLDALHYQQRIQQEIKYCIEQQELLGLDVLVHGEAERNDMVEYFGEQLDGYIFSEFGWVQSYGSRCVKPPIIIGDISRKNTMTVKWTQYAQSLTNKPVKGMLTGPVTMLNWSFVRDDQSRRDTCRQLALAIREEVQDLEQAGIAIIQIDEAALREGLPLKNAQKQAYLEWAIECFRISANGVSDQTQIHTHMCYSNFNDIIDAIAAMDADVVTIETSRSDLALLKVFERFAYPNAIGPGVYDIHSANIPSVETITGMLEQAAKYIPLDRLWINPDCGLKTRNWKEVNPALSAMVNAAKQLRSKVLNQPANNKTKISISA